MLNYIFKRKSVRTFDNKGLSPEQKQLILDYINDENHLIGVNGHKIKLHLIENDDIKGKIGTYGFIKGANTYVAATAKKDKEYMVDVGYVLEKFVLFATSKGLGTCWLGGTFDRNKIVSAVSLEEDEFVPVITPIGVPADKKSLQERIIRKGVGAANRKDQKELFFSLSFDEPMANKYLYDVLEYVRVAPSASNKQPWRILFVGDVAHFYLERTSNYGSDRYDIQMIDIGIAICHYELASTRSQFFIENDPLLNSKLEYVISVK